MFEPLSREEKAEFTLRLVQASDEELKQALAGVEVFKKLIKKEMADRGVK